MKLIIAVILVASMIGYAGELTSPKIGDNAPEFKLKNYDGKEYELAKVTKENKYTVVMFISTECPVSNSYNERMVKLYDSYNAKGVAILAVNANKAEDVKTIASHSKTHGFKFPVLKDEKNKIADLYGAQVTPETYIIDAKGKILYHGRIDDNRKGDNIQSKDLANALDMLLDGKPVAIAETKAMGCTIKRLGTD
jgi:peroxiredoxin